MVTTAPPLHKHPPPLVVAPAARGRGGGRGGACSFWAPDKSAVDGAAAGAACGGGCLRRRLPRFGTGAGGCARSDCFPDSFIWAPGLLRCRCPAPAAQGGIQECGNGLLGWDRHGPGPPRSLRRPHRRRWGQRRCARSDAPGREVAVQSGRARQAVAPNFKSIITSVTHRKIGSSQSRPCPGAPAVAPLSPRAPHGGGTGNRRAHIRRALRPPGPAVAGGAG
jgi:hypothetical protein